MSSKLSDGYKQALSKLMNKHEVTLCWVRGYSNVDSNEIGDELVRLGSSMDICEARTSLKPTN